MIAQFTEIFNNFMQFAQHNPLLAISMILIGVICVGAAAAGLKI